MAPRSYPCLLKIYLLRNDVDEEIYAGSTTNLQKRLWYHKSDAKRACEKGRKLYDHINKIGWEHFYAESLYEFYCEDAEYAGQSEEIAIDCFGTLNSNKAHRTLEDYKAYNSRPKSKASRKAYRATLKGKQTQQKFEQLYRSDPNRGGKLIYCPCSKRQYKKYTFKGHCHTKRHKHYLE